jgi:alpha-beta hydrolase superfamily lysophospholipase
VTEDTTENAKATVIITHGIAEHSGRYHKMTEILNQNGYNVIKYDLRGHGQSAGARGKLKHHLDMIHDLHELVVEAKKYHVPIYLLGHSLGGLIVHMYAVTYQDVNGIIVSGAITDYIKDVLPLRIFGPKLLGWYSVKTNFADNKLSRIRDVEKEYIQDPFNLKALDIYKKILKTTTFQHLFYMVIQIKLYRIIWLNPCIKLFQVVIKK